MATGEVYYAQVGTPPAAVGRVHYAGLALPNSVTGFVYHAAFTTGSPSTGSGRIFHAAFTTSASPDAVAPSGLKQRTSTEAWWDVAVHQRTAAGEWV